MEAVWGEEEMLTLTVITWAVLLSRRRALTGHSQEQLILRMLEQAGSWLHTFCESSECEHRVQVLGSWVGMVAIIIPVHGRKK